MTRGFQVAMFAFGMFHVFALNIVLIGNFGLFRQDRYPLSDLLLIPLGLPWNHYVDNLVEKLWPWFAAGAPTSYPIRKLLQ